jgi:small basic protein
MTTKKIKAAARITVVKIMAIGALFFFGCSTGVNVFVSAIYLLGFKINNNAKVIISLE